jgi:hypothetical protein
VAVERRSPIPRPNGSIKGVTAKRFARTKMARTVDGDELFPIRPIALVLRIAPFLFDFPAAPP